MPGTRADELVMVPVAALVAFGRDTAWPRLRRAGAAVAAWPPLLPTRRRLGRLPALAAMPLFLVPEGCSRLGTLGSAWLLIQGDWWQALAVYTAAKVLAGGTALWIYTACEPALLQIKAFALLHTGLATARRTLVARIRTRADRPRLAPPP